jgi:hypothetical protein
VATGRGKGEEGGCRQGFFRWFWRFGDRFLLSAACDLGVGFVWVVENFSGRAIVNPHSDLSGTLESG